MKSNKLSKEKWNLAFFWCGLVGVLLTFVPHLVLGKDAIFTYHDQLDGELIAYLLQAKHMFDGPYLPEFMGGLLSKTALTLPAPAFVLLFLGGNAYFGLLAMLLIGRVSGYVGMYLLARKLTARKDVLMDTESHLPAVLAAFCYALLPFLPVYGLSQFGIPLVCYCALLLCEGRKGALPYIGIVLYGLTSSLVLVGFGVLGLGVLVLIFCAVKHCEVLKRLLAAWGMLLGVYVIENLRLLLELLGVVDVPLSHKSEYVLTPEPFGETFWTYLTAGGQHSEDVHWAVMLFGLIVFVVSFFWKKDELQGIRRKMALCLCLNVAFCLVAALWESAIGVWIGKFIPVLGSFQLDRLLWLAPCFWYLLFALASAALLRMGKQILTGTAVLLVFGLTAGMILLSGDIKTNVQKLRNPDYGIMSFSDYYAIGVLDQVEEYIRRTTGLESSAYRVASLGIDPAAAYYHGFYCLDGYSNNYPLAYKHAFRKVIAPELARSEYLSAYFDDWGNRCYLFSAETPGYYTIEKTGFYFRDYRWNVEAFKAMGGEYLLSAAYIQNAESQGLTLVREEPFETPESYYRIFLYQVQE